MWCFCNQKFSDKCQAMEFREREVCIPDVQLIMSSFTDINSSVKTHTVMPYHTLCMMCARDGEK